MSILDRVACMLCIWALTRLFGYHDPLSGAETDCLGCKSGYLINEMRKIQSGE